MANSEEVKQLLETVFPQQAWEISSAEGWAGTAYIAAHDKQRVFVKFDVPVAALQRLAALRITPALLAAGDLRGVPYAIQEHLDTPPPDPDWFTRHLEVVARVVKVYQSDSVLEEILATLDLTCRPESRGDVDGWYVTLRLSFPEFNEFESAYERFSANWISNTHRMVATHGDLSRKNFLQTATGIYVVDWDDIALADPLRDIGPFAWWYLPPSRWADFFRAYGEDFSDQLPRLYWWVARTSLDVALGLATRGARDRALDFLEDFVAAAHHKENPHGWWYGGRKADPHIPWLP